MALIALIFLGWCLVAIVAAGLCAAAALGDRRLEAICAFNRELVTAHEHPLAA